ncbi:hypothetical protein QZH41_008172, partial [Actinostola sp. cb2023]
MVYLPYCTYDMTYGVLVYLCLGFGDHIKWHTYKDGLKVAKESNKSMVLIIHKTTCASCKYIKGQFSNDKNLGEWSEKFVMVNVKDTNEPEGKQFQPDGSYVPRILFLGKFMDSNGKVMSEFWNEGTAHKHVKYYYQDGTE